jgi:hypothetical protein
MGAYDRYLKRLQSQKNERPELEMVSRGIRSLSEPFTAMNRQLARTLNMDNASLGAKIVAQQRGQMQIHGMAEQMGSQAQQQYAQRNQQLDTEIAKAEAMAEQERAQKAQKNTQMLRAGISAAGMIVGAALAIPTGGLSLVAGAALGGGLGSALGGFVGIGKGGQLSVDPEDWDMNATVEGLQQAGSIYASEATSRKMQTATQEVTTKMPALVKKMQEIDDENVVTQYLATINMQARTGDIDGMQRSILDFLNYGNPVVDNPQPFEWRK